MLSAMKAASALICLLLMPGLAFAQVTPRAQIGVCVDPDKFDAAQAAGFDYVETNASKVAALTDDEFQKLAAQVAQLKIPLAASMSFVPGAIKLTGPDVDPAKQMTYVAGVLGRLNKLGVKVVVFGSGGAPGCRTGSPKTRHSRSWWISSPDCARRPRRRHYDRGRAAAQAGNEHHQHGPRGPRAREGRGPA